MIYYKVSALGLKVDVLLSILSDPHIIERGGSVFRIISDLCNITALNFYNLSFYLSDSCSVGDRLYL